MINFIGLDHDGATISDPKQILIKNIVFLQTLISFHFLATKKCSQNYVFSYLCPKTISPTFFIIHKQIKMDPNRAHPWRSAAAMISLPRIRWTSPAQHPGTLKPRAWVSGFCNPPSGRAPGRPLLFWSLLLHAAWCLLLGSLASGSWVKEHPATLPFSTSFNTPSRHEILGAKHRRLSNGFQGAWA